MVRQSWSFASKWVPKQELGNQKSISIQKEMSGGTGFPACAGQAKACGQILPL
jgi:hypothetical protein